MRYDLVAKIDIDGYFNTKKLYLIVKLDVLIEVI